ncbi:MAG: hypothetical protein AAF493_28015 [Pseudomonadota bacterium]
MFGLHSRIVNVNFRRLILVALLSTTGPSHGETLRVAFVSPSYPGSVFWDRVTAVMQAAANDLKIRLSVIYASKSANIDRANQIRVVESLANAPQKPHYLLTAPLCEHGMLKDPGRP